MLKNRLIFTLLYNEESYMLSRNFRLQKVGNIEWLKKYYNFYAIAFSIDELVVLNVGRGEKNIDKFSRYLTHLSRDIFMPFAAGGGIRSLRDVYKLFNAGIDKVILNTPFIEQPKLVSSIAKVFGRQAVVASIDCKKEREDYCIYINNGSERINLKLEELIKRVEGVGAGEIYLTSIDRDGTGQGYDIELLNRVSSITQLPVIASGGAGKYEHFVEAIKEGGITAVSTANLYNFMVDGLSKARKFIQQRGLELTTWDYNLEKFHNYFQKR